MHIVCELHTWSIGVNTNFLSLFGAVELTKNADKHTYGYSGYDIGF